MKNLCKAICDNVDCPKNILYEDNYKFITFGLMDIPDLSGTCSEYIPVNSEEPEELDFND